MLLLYLRDQIIVDTGFNIRELASDNYTIQLIVRIFTAHEERRTEPFENNCPNRGYVATRTQGRC